MLPLDKVQGLISKHSKLEKDLSSGEIDKNTFAEKFIFHTRIHNTDSGIQY